MASNAFSFRLSPSETDWVLSQALDGETQHQTAQRLIRQLYQQSQGHTKTESTASQQPVYNTDDSVDSRVEERLKEIKADLYNELADQIQGLIEVRLGESPA
jgi:hypothetical protein